MRTQTKVTSLLAVSSLLLFAAVAAGAGIESTDVKPVDTGKCFMWQVTGKGSTAYLLGSMHACGKDMYPLNPAIENAFAQCDVLVLEMDMSPATQASASQVVVKEGMYGNNESLSQNLSEDTMTKLDAYLRAHGMQTSQVGKFKPWLLLMTLAMQEVQFLGYDPANGVDMHFLEQASTAGKPVKGLETAEEQLTALSSALVKIQEKELVEFLDETPEHIRSVCEAMAAAWKAGDATALNTLIENDLSKDPDSREFDIKVIRERSVTMADRLAGFMADGKKYFAIVGAAHLVGDRNIVSLLQAKGFTVTQVRKSTAKAPAASAAIAAIESSAPAGK